MSEEIDRWIAYMKAHPNSWKKVHTAFINAQFEKSDAFIKRLAKTKGGKEKIIAAYKIKNMNGYKKLLS